MSDKDGSGRPASQSTKDLILDAALEVFGEKGYDGATTKEIASRAHVNEVTIFRIFKTKSGLFEAVLSNRFPFAQVMKELHFDRSLSPNMVLEENAMTVLKLLQTNRNLFFVLIADIPRLATSPHLVRSAVSNLVVGPLGGYLASQMDAGRLRSMDTEVAARAFFGMVQSYFMFNYVLEKREVDVQADRRFVRGFVSIFLDGLRGQANG